ncbi:MAG: hypothetical protein PHD37_01265 [Gallionellaceae bacterium]|nr:hypothetical protein [Gallionellaceae bacterium]
MLDAGHLHEESFALVLQGIHPHLQGTVQSHDALLDGAGQLLQPLLVFRFRGLPVLHVLTQHLSHPFRGQHPFHHPLQHQLVDAFHGQVGGGADTRRGADFVAAFVVAIPPALAGGRGHGAAAGLALDEAGQQNRRGGVPGCFLPLGVLVRVHGLALAPHRVPGLLTDDERHRRAYPLAFGTDLAGAGVAHVEAVLAAVGVARQHLLHLLDLPGPTAHQQALPVEVLGDGLHAHGLAVQAVEVEVVNLPDDEGFALVDL